MKVCFILFFFNCVWGLIWGLFQRGARGGFGVNDGDDRKPQLFEKGFPIDRRQNHIL